MKAPTPAQLSQLEAQIAQALRSGDTSPLRILGYGEISTVVALQTDDGGYACKRMPPLGDPAQFEPFRALFEEYVARLEALGCPVVASTLEQVARSDGSPAIYCVQPMLHPHQLLVAHCADASTSDGLQHLEVISERVLTVVSPELGLDGQLSNWALVDGQLLYLDLTTPLLRAPDGSERLDTEVHLASLPWALRGLVRRFMVRRILDHYFSARAVLLDLAANLHKERLTRLIPGLLESINARLDEPIREDEVRAYYRDDALTWELLLRARRADRMWQRRVRRRDYPFLLPGKIAR